MVREVTHCSHEPDSKVVWGLYDRTEPMNEAKLCKECSDKLWAEIRGTVGAGIMHYEVNGL